MSDFYEKPHGCAFHPGGWELTRYAVEKCNFPKGAKLCDIGCGMGDTVDRLRNELGFDAVGVEPSEGMSGGREDVFHASAEDTGFMPDETDGVLFECVLSLTDCPEAALTEANRILKRGGKLIISDLYADEGALLSEGPIGRVFSEAEIKSITAEYGFELELFEDHTHEMVTMAMQMFMDGAGEEMCGLFRKLREIRARYFLLIARKV